MERCGISFESIADYHDGRADESLAARVQEHLTLACPVCRDNLDWLEQAQNRLRATTSVRVPRPLVESAYALFHERYPVPARKSIFARLQFDGRAPNALALSGARNREQEGYQLIFDAGQYDIDLFLEPAEQGTWYLIGQALHKPLPAEADNEDLVPQEVILTADDGKQASINPVTAEFHVPSLATGSYELRLRLPGEDIVIPHVLIGRSLQETAKG